MEHNIYLDSPLCWVVFNDQMLPVSPVTEEDFDTVVVGNVAARCRDAAWSSNCEWFFIVRETDILLLRVSDERGLRCRRKTAGFMEWFMQSGLNVRPPKRPRT